MNIVELNVHDHRLESLKDSVRERFMHVDPGYSAGLRWRAIDGSFRKSYIDWCSNKLEAYQTSPISEDVREIVLDHVRDVLSKRDALKINTVFNNEFVASDKSAN